MLHRSKRFKCTMFKLTAQGWEAHPDSPKHWQPPQSKTGGDSKEDESPWEENIENSCRWQPKTTGGAHEVFSQTLQLLQA